MTKVKEVMSKNCKHVSSSTTVQEAAQIMKEMDIGFLPISDNDKLIGMITDRDIVVRTLANGKDIKSTSVKEAMTPKCLYCFEEDTIEEVTDNFGRNQIHRMPVLNSEKRLVGVLTVGDLMRKGLKEHAANAFHKIHQPSK